MPARNPEYTGQYSNTADFGLMFYNARWYDPGLGRFAQADSVVPGGVQGYDRYAYANNSPLVFTDPTGHFGNHNDDKSDYWNKRNKEKVRQLEKQWDDEKALKNLKQTAQATSKEMALDPSLALAWGGGGVGKSLFASLGGGQEPPPEDFQYLAETIRWIWRNSPAFLEGAWASTGHRILTVDPPHGAGPWHLNTDLRALQPWLNHRTLTPLMGRVMAGSLRLFSAAAYAEPVPFFILKFQLCPFPFSESITT